ncbi:MAG: maleylpyruvate isomerase N-terminal domain-containing protein, partial [Nocardioides sp.]
MPTHLSFDQHLAGLRDATVMLARHASVAGLDVAVPSCPEWTVRRLIGHQGRVHRWTSAVLRGERIDKEATEKAGRSSADPIEWLRDGAIALVTSLVALSEDAEAMVFLADAPAPRLFWVRRQHHETTMHAVDALAASLGRLPRAAETWIGVGAALDGIDELLMGFVPREVSPLRSASGAEPMTIAIRTPDAPYSWTVHVSDQAPVVTRHDGL